MAFGEVQGEARNRDVPLGQYRATLRPVSWLAVLVVRLIAVLKNWNSSTNLSSDLTAFLGGMSLALHYPDSHELV